MSRGEPLDDGDRLPWLRALRRFLEETLAGVGKAVLTRPALKHAYRPLLMDGLPGIAPVYLRGDRALVEARVQTRRGHDMKAGMVASQFEAWEEPIGALVVDASREPAEVRFIRKALEPGKTGLPAEVAAAGSTDLRTLKK